MVDIERCCKKCEENNDCPYEGKKLMCPTVQGYFEMDTRLKCVF